MTVRFEYKFMWLYYMLRFSLYEYFFSSQKLKYDLNDIVTLKEFSKFKKKLLFWDLYMIYKKKKRSIIFCVCTMKLKL